MRLVDDGALPGRPRWAIITPREGRIDDATARHERSIVPLVKRQVVGSLHAVAEQSGMPAQLTDDGRGIGVQQQLVGIETMAHVRLVGAVYAVAINGAGPGVGQKAVPHLIGKFRQLNPLDLSLALLVKETQLDLGRVGGKQGEIDAEPGPGCA
jgi:hypothetical protein